MNFKDLEYVKTIVKDYSKISSLSGSETNLMNTIIWDIDFTSTTKTRSLYSIEVRKDCTFVKSLRNKSNTTIMIHIDRIPVAPYQFTFDNGFWTGQNDNVISVAIARWLIWKRLPFNFLFTTREEICANSYQILEFIKDHPEQDLIDLDIDVTKDPVETTSGAVSIRKRDNQLQYPAEYVNRFTEICKRENIKYIHKDGHWLIVQLGMALHRLPKEELPKNFTYIGIPLISYHSNHEIASEECIKGVMKLLSTYAKEQSK